MKKTRFLTLTPVEKWFPGVCDWIITHCIFKTN